MSLNVENAGTPVVLCETKDKKYRKIISIDDGKGSIAYPFKELKLQGDDKFQQVPNPNGRQILYITGQSGSGKSVYTANYAKQYKKMFKDNEIYLFSALDGDSSIDKIKGIKRIKLEGNEFLTTELDAKDFANALCIFDDCDVIKNKSIEKKVHSLMDNMLQIGRHHNTSIIYTTHTATNNRETKVILAEAHSITIFPKSMGNASLKYLCDAYLGLDKKEIAQLKKLEGRWVTITRTFPKVVFSEQYIYIPSARDEEPH
jgi:hypothetical protein